MARASFMAEDCPGCSILAEGIDDMKRFFLFLAVLLTVAASVLAQSQPLFEPELGHIYNYCPSIFVEDGVTHIYYCTNTSPNIVTDSIGYRYSLDGVTYSDETIVLQTARDQSAWDSAHTCDPDVIKGEFHWNGETYSYLMAYLGCDTRDNEGNEVGLAVAKEPGGPFIKLDHLNPFVAFERDVSNKSRRNAFQWGVGTPSLVSMDKKGQVMLIYSRNDLTGQKSTCQKWDLSDLNNPQPIGGENWELDITRNGSLWRNLKTINVGNADMVYDPVSGCLYTTSGDPYIEGVDVPGEPTFVSAYTRVLKFTQQCMSDEMENFFLPDGTAKWQLLTRIGPDDSGYPRNHNAGLMGDAYGWMAEQGVLQVFYTVSEVGRPNKSLWTYRIHRYTVHLEDE